MSLHPVSRTFTATYLHGFTKHIETYEGKEENAIQSSLLN